jgi:hypothetical protein
MANEGQLDRDGWIFVIVLMGGAAVEGVRAGLGHTDDLRFFWVRWGFVLGCVLWAIIYATVREEESYKKFFAILEILIAAALTYYQLTKLSETGWQHKDVVDRLTFLLGSIALMSKGMKDAYS